MRTATVVSVTDGPAEPIDDIPTTRLRTTVQRTSTALKVTAALLAIGTIVASAISATTDLNQFYGGPAVQFPWRVQLSNFLGSAVPNLAWAALVYAAATALQIASTRLTRPRAPSVEPFDQREGPPVRRGCPRRPRR